VWGCFDAVPNTECADTYLTAVQKQPSFHSRRQYGTGRRGDEEGLLGSFRCVQAQVPRTARNDHQPTPTPNQQLLSTLHQPPSTGHQAPSTPNHQPPSTPNHQPPTNNHPQPPLHPPGTEKPSSPPCAPPSCAPNPLISYWMRCSCSATGTRSSKRQNCQLHHSSICWPCTTVWCWWCWCWCWCCWG